MHGPAKSAPAEPGDVKAAMPGEITLAMLFICVFILAQLLVSRSFFLFSRNFWSDEIVTHTLVSDPDLARSIRALGSGLDTNPPGFHLLLRAFTRITGSADEVPLRCFALLSIQVALLGVYVSLRQAYSPLVALTATFAVWTHPLVLWHAFEARMYGPWLAASIWFCYLLSRRQRFSPGLWSRVLLALTAVVLCTVHTLGVVCFTIIVAFEVLLHRPPGRSRWYGLWPAVSGPLTLFAWGPFVLEQRTAYTVSFLREATLQQVAVFGEQIFLPQHLAAFVAVAWLAQVFGRGKERTDAGPGNGVGALAGLTGLFILPAVLVLISYTLEPLLVTRYAIPAVGALAPAAAFTMRRIAWPWLLGLCVFLFLVGTYKLHQHRTGYWKQDQQTARLIDAIRLHTGNDPVFFETANELYPVCRYAPDLAGRCFALDFEAYYRYHWLISGRIYSKPVLVRLDALHGLRRKYIVPGEGVTVEGRYPGFTARAVADQLHELIEAPGEPRGRFRRFGSPSQE